MAKKLLPELENTLGYHFNDTSLLSQALTHSSRKNELFCSNERLEFLGDAILGALVSEFLYRNRADYTEGDLTRVKSVVVSRDTLTTAGRELDLEAYLMVAKGLARPFDAEPDTAGDTDPRRAERLPASLLADAFEAIVAAIYLDGGPEAARGFILRHLGESIEEACRSSHIQNFKSILQQLVQRKMGTMPEYLVIGESGPDHVKSFEVVTLIEGRRYGAGRGRTKKSAEQRAAAETLAMLGQAQGAFDEE